LTNLALKIYNFISSRVRRNTELAMALEGIKVIDCSQVAAVPMAARILGDFGADVIKIENPTTGDYWRSFKDAQLNQGIGWPSEFDFNFAVFRTEKIRARVRDTG
jgi:hypothetical protein